MVEVGEHRPTADKRAERGGLLRGGTEELDFAAGQVDLREQKAARLVDDEVRELLHILPLVHNHRAERGAHNGGIRDGNARQRRLLRLVVARGGGGGGARPVNRPPTAASARRGGERRRRGVLRAGRGLLQQRKFIARKRQTFVPRATEAQRAEVTLNILCPQCWGRGHRGPRGGGGADGDGAERHEDTAAAREERVLVEEGAVVRGAAVSRR